MKRKGGGEKRCVCDVYVPREGGEENGVSDNNGYVRSGMGRTGERHTCPRQSRERAYLDNAVNAETQNGTKERRKSWGNR